jgi:hypothetical protein
MERERPRWRIRISTLMLLVIIAALAAALVVEHRKRVLSEQLAAANEQKARAEAERALAEAQLARDQARQSEARFRKLVDGAKGSMRTPPTETPGPTTPAGPERKEGGP